MCLGNKVKAVAIVDPNAITRALLTVKLARNGDLVTAFESSTDFLGSPPARWDLVVVRALIAILQPLTRCVPRLTARCATSSTR